MYFSLLILTLVVLQRIAELAISRRNTNKLLANGGIEYGAAHYPVIVALHTLWIAGLFYFSWGAAINWVWLGIYLGLQALRGWVIAALGERWTTRVIVMPGQPLVELGPYRYLRHPNYAVVAAEIFVLPMVWDLFWYAVIFSIANAAMIAWRIRVEEQALRPLR